MRVLWPVLMLLTVALSGCSGAGGLNLFLMQPHETPPSCLLMPYNGEDGQRYEEMFNWTGNPGKVDNQLFTRDGVTPIDNLVAIYDCDGDELVSIAMRYATPEEAQHFGEGLQDCGVMDDYEVEVGVVAGTVVAFVDADRDISKVESAVRAWRDRVMQLAGTPNPCAA